MKNKQKLMKLEEKIEKIAFFEKSIFRIFGLLENEKMKSSKMWKFHQTIIFFYRGIRKKGLKLIFWTIWTIPEIFFFWPSRRELVKIFIFCKKLWKK